MKTIIAAVMALSLTSFSPAHDRADNIKPSAPTAYYQLPAAFKYLPRQVVAPLRANYVQSQECGIFNVTNPSATVPARVIVKNCDGTESEIWIQPGTTITTNCLDTFNTLTFNVVEGQISIPQFLHLCTP